MNIIVNGEPRLVGETSGLTFGNPAGTGHLGYDQIIQMAGFAPGRILSVTYHTRRKGDEQREGILSPGRSVLIEEGMIFNAYDTSNA